MAEDNRHPNSKRVTLYRAGSFLENAQTAAQDFMSMSKQSIGSYFSGTLGGSAGTGLSFPEVDLLLPLLIDIPKDDRTFREKVKEFYQNICTRVPYGSGVELEVGLTLSNEKGVTYTEGGVPNLPIDIKAYIRYRHALGHPQVAASRDQALGNMLKMYYVSDPEAEEAASAVAGKIKDEAVTIYLGLKADGEKVDAMLTMLGVDIRAYHGTGAADGKARKLYELADGTPEHFMKVHKTDNFDQRFLIRKMLNVGLLKMVGGAILDSETNGIIGYSVEEVIVYLKDPKNSDLVSILKQKTQELMKKKLQPVKKPPQGRITATAR